MSIWTITEQLSPGQQIQKWAQERYHKGYGYQVLIECHEADDLDNDEFFVEGGRVNWSAVKTMVDAWNEQYAATREDF